MKLSEFTKSAPPSGAATPEVSPSSPELVAASPQAPEEQYVTSVTPSGIEVYYSWAPRRHYKLRFAGTDAYKAGISPPNDVGWTEVPSVTTVLGVLEKPQLVWWGQGVGVEGTLELLKRKLIRHYQGAYMIGGEFGSDGLLGASEATRDGIVSLLTEHKLTVNHQRDKAADRGVNVHDALEQTFYTGDYPDPKHERWQEHERGYVRGIVEFLKAIEGAYNVEDAQQELMVGSLEHQYAGRFDLVLTLSKPVEVVTKCYPKKPPKVEEIPAGRYLLDLKTSKRVYETHYLQLEAYEAAAVECGYAPTDYRGVVHVTADGKYELALNKDWTLDDFLTVRACYQTMHERKIVQALRDELSAKDAA